MIVKTIFFTVKFSEAVPDFFLLFVTYFYLLLFYLEYVKRLLSVLYTRPISHSQVIMCKISFPQTR